MYLYRKDKITQHAIATYQLCEFFKNRNTVQVDDTFFKNICIWGIGAVTNPFVISAVPLIHIYTTNGRKKGQEMRTAVEMVSY